MTLLKISNNEIPKSNKPSEIVLLSPVSADLVWPEENEIDLSLALLTK
jgi:hypothetical protein